VAGCRERNNRRKKGKGRWYKELSGKTAEQLVLLGLNPMRFLSGEFKEGSTAEEIAAFKKWHKEHA
jgi:hypothetical protein